MSSTMNLLGIFALACIQVASAGLIQQILDKKTELEYLTDAEPTEVDSILNFLNEQAKLAADDTEYTVEFAARWKNACNALGNAAKAEGEPAIKNPNMFLPGKNQFTAVGKDGRELKKMDIATFYECHLHASKENEKEGKPFHALIALETMKLKKVDKSVKPSGWEETNGQECDGEMYFAFAEQSAMEGNGKPASEGNNYALVDSFIVETEVVGSFNKKVVESFSENPRNLLPISDKRIGTGSS